jgi:signal transduction histidine kinase
MIGHDVTPTVLAERRELVAQATLQELLARLPVTLWEVDRFRFTARPLFPDRREQPDPEWGRYRPLAETFAFLADESIGDLAVLVAESDLGGAQTLTVKSVDGQRRMQVSLSTVAASPDDMSESILVVLTDVTDDFVEAETDRRMDHAAHVMRFAQGVAHDFGNVAQVIGGYSEMLARSQDPAIVEQASRRLQSAAMRAVEVSRRIAKIARVQQVVNGPVNLSELIAEQIDILRGELDTALHLTLTTKPDMVAFAERQQVASAVENLCLNAAQAMGGSGHIHVDVSPVMDHGRSYVQVMVADDGPGIPSEILDRVFDPFVSGRPTAGTGLGLYLIQEYLYSVGGQVLVESSDQGAIFRMRFQTARDRQRLDSIPSVDRPGTAVSA